MTPFGPLFDPFWPSLLALACVLDEAGDIYDDRRKTMSGHLSPLQKAIFRRVDEVLYYIWDPIGVHDLGDARDEYETYVPQVVGLLFEEKGKKALFDHLYLLESERMGLSITEESLAHTKEVVDILHSHYESLKKKADPVGTDNDGAAHRRV